MEGGRPATCDHFLCFFFIPFLKSFSKLLGHLFSLPVFSIQFISTGLSFLIDSLLRPASVSLFKKGRNINSFTSRRASRETLRILTSFCFETLERAKQSVLAQGGRKKDWVLISCIFIPLPLSLAISSDVDKRTEIYTPSGSFVNLGRRNGWEGPLNA